MKITNPSFLICFYLLSTAVNIFLTLTTLKLIRTKLNVAPVVFGRTIVAFGTGLTSLLVVVCGAGLHAFLNGIALNPTLSDWHPRLVWILLSPVAPIIEELAFRAGQLGILLPRFGVRTSILLSAVVFGSLHLYNAFQGSEINVWQILGCVEGAIILSILYLRWGLFASISFHWVWNFSQVPLMMGFLSIERKSLTQFEGFPSVLFVNFIAILLLLPQLKKLKVAASPDRPILVSER